MYCYGAGIAADTENPVTIDRDCGTCMHMASTTLVFLLLTSLFHVSWAKSVDRLALGQVYFDESKDPPTNVLQAGDCVEHILPRKHGNLIGAMEACMRIDCNLEVGERGITPPRYESNTSGQGSNCFLKLQEKGGLDIFRSDLDNPVLVKTLRENTDKPVSDVVGYEITLRDLYHTMSNYSAEYEKGRFTREPTLVIHRLDWMWFTENHFVNSQIVSTFPLSSYQDED